MLHRVPSSMEGEGDMHKDAVLLQGAAGSSHEKGTAGKDEAKRSESGWGYGAENGLNEFEEAHGLYHGGLGSCV